MNFLKNKTVLCFGDSWTGGHDLDPTTNNMDIGDPIHYDYRTKDTWPSFLEAKETVNLGIPGGSNDEILRTLIEHITTEYVSVGKSTDDLFIIVGWSSPCRKELIMSDLGGSGRAHRETLWANIAEDYVYSEPMYEMYKLHVKYFWSEAEMFNDYVHHNLYLQSFLDGLGIKFLAFNAFYEFPFQIAANEKSKYFSALSTFTHYLREKTNEIFDDRTRTVSCVHHEYGDISNLKDVFEKDKEVWEKNINNNTYYYKEDFTRSYRGYLGSRIWDKAYFDDCHPTRESNIEWADELSRFINSKWSDG